MGYKENNDFSTISQDCSTFSNLNLKKRTGGDCRWGFCRANACSSHEGKRSPREDVPNNERERGTNLGTCWKPLGTRTRLRVHDCRIQEPVSKIQVECTWACPHYRKLNKKISFRISFTDLRLGTNLQFPSFHFVKLNWTWPLLIRQIIILNVKEELLLLQTSYMISGHLHFQGQSSLIYVIMGVFSQARIGCVTFLFSNK